MVSLCLARSSVSVPVCSAGRGPITLLCVSAVIGRKICERGVKGQIKWKDRRQSSGRNREHRYVPVSQKAISRDFMFPCSTRGPQETKVE